jgi:hypothetical protein
MNLNGGLVSAASGSLTPITAHGTRGTVVGENEVSGIAAIIAPQAASVSNKLFKITLNGGSANEVSYYYTPSTDITFEAGKKYNYILTINHAGITVTSSIEDWISGGEDIIGDGTLE